MPDQDCKGCIHRVQVRDGMIEHMGEYLDTFTYECRRFPPQRGFWSTGFPKAFNRCGEFANVEGGEGDG